MGWDQAAALKQHCQQLQQSFRVDVVVVSPLTRTLETAAAVFGGGLWSPQDLGTPLMAQTEVPGLRTAHPAISCVGSPPFIAFEACREHLGKHFCDRRRSISKIQPSFPGVDFSLIQDDEDVLWKHGEREAADEIKRRGLRFIQWLMQRPETHIAVVAHGGFLWHCLSNFGRHASPSVQGELHVWYENCEMRSVVLSNEGGVQQRPDHWRFAGGRHVVTPRTD